MEDLNKKHQYLEWAIGARARNQECCLKLLEEGLLVSFQDLGAAGITSSASEMAAKGGVGIEIETIFDHMGGDYRVYAGALPFMMVVRNLRDAMMSSHLQRLP